MKGRTQSRFLSAEEAVIVRRQIEGGHQLSNDVDAVWKLCEQAADKELADLEADPQEAAEKRGPTTDPNGVPYSAMHRSAAGANKMLALPCYKRNGKFEDFSSGARSSGQRNVISFS